MSARIHGGTDVLGAARWDFSSNANACGPCPLVLEQVHAADATHYPDPGYWHLREHLARLHEVDPGRILIAGSASEFIQRFTAWRFREGARRVWMPEHCYGDYAHAAQAWGLPRVSQPSAADMAWLCDPGSPLGQNESPAMASSLLDLPWMAVVLDAAYAPLRLVGEPALSAGDRHRCWQMWSPNKALGMTGIRGAYVIAPLQADDTALRSLEALAPSWPVGAHAQAMLQAWTLDEVQDWVTDSRERLVQWKDRLVQLLEQRGWRVLPSVTPYLCARPPQPLDVGGLREASIKLRDATSFGLSGWWRLSAQPPDALAALEAALDRMPAREVLS